MANSRSFKQTRSSLSSSSDLGDSNMPISRPPLPPPTVTFGRRTSSGRYISYSRDDLDSELGSGDMTSGDYSSYTVHIPPTPDNQPMDTSVSQKVEEQYVSSSLFTGGFNSVTRAHLMDKVIESETNHPQMPGANGSSCQIPGCDAKVMTDERGVDILPCECDFKICRECYIDAVKTGGGICPGCKEPYRNGDMDEVLAAADANRPLSLPPAVGMSKMERRLSLMKSTKSVLMRSQTGDFDHNCWLFETKGTYGYGNAIWPSENGGFNSNDSNHGSEPAAFINKPWKPLTRKLKIPAAVLSPYRLQGNPICQLANQLNIVQFCSPQTKSGDAPRSSKNTTSQCLIQSCPEYYEYVEESPVPCFCAAPIRVGFRLKSPSFSDFRPYEDRFKEYVTSGLHLNTDQLYIDSFEWEVGPCLRLYLKLFPEFNNHSNTFSNSQIKRVRSLLTYWATPEGPIFGPYELLNFTLLGPYANELPDLSNSGISKGSLAGIILGIIAGSLIVSITLIIFTMRRKRSRLSRKRQSSRASLKIEGVKAFTFEQMVLATNNFSDSNQIGQGGYGKVYRGNLSDGTIVAVKRALKGSLQGDKEFLTEIELLSRVHHRNLVSLIGYCDEADEQKLVYEFMENGTLRDHLSVKSYEPLSFPIRIRIVLDSAKGILYLHTEADPPIFHRDIKANNILLDSKFTAKVADFGLSKLAPVSDYQGVITSHISTVVKGTPGYLDLEYFLTHKLTDKSDVYSLGVVFLEILTGMQAISHGKNIVREVIQG